jgi:hypothetical protein
VFDTRHIPTFLGNRSKITTEIKSLTTILLQTKTYHKISRPTFLATDVPKICPAEYGGSLRDFNDFRGFH